MPIIRGAETPYACVPRHFNHWVVVSRGYGASVTSLIVCVLNADNDRCADTSHADSVQVGLYGLQRGVTDRQTGRASDDAMPRPRRDRHVTTASPSARP